MRILRETSPGRLRQGHQAVIRYQMKLPFPQPCPVSASTLLSIGGDAIQRCGKVAAKFGVGSDAHLR